MSGKVKNGTYDPEAVPPEKVPIRRESSHSVVDEKETNLPEHLPLYLRYITLIARTWAIITIIVLWIITILILQENYAAEKRKYPDAIWYLFPVCIVYSFWECLWIINKCVIIGDCQKDTRCCRVWSWMVWIEDWRKSLLYLALALPMFAKGIVIAQTIVIGVMMIISAMLYIVKSFKKSQCISRKDKQSKYIQTGFTPLKTVAAPQQVDGGQATGYNSTGATSVQPPTKGSIDSKEKEGSSPLPVEVAPSDKAISGTIPRDNPPPPVPTLESGLPRGQVASYNPQPVKEKSMFASLLSKKEEKKEAPVVLQSSKPSKSEAYNPFDSDEEDF